MKRMQKLRRNLFVTAGLVFFCTAIASTPAETNLIVSVLLNRLAGEASFDCFRADRSHTARTVYHSWEAWLEGGKDSWSLNEKTAAFDWYLSTLGTNDCRSLNEVAQEHVRLALLACKRFQHTNAWSQCKALALNPRGVCRGEAMELAVKYGPVNDAMTDFVEMVGTNVVMYDYEERGSYSFYEERLLAILPTNVVACAVRDRAIQRFYRNRMVPSAAGAVSRDGLFCSFLSGYSHSSNRLEFACHILGLEEGRENDGDYFSDVTNRLLSSGQPLRQLPIGEGQNE